MDDTERYALAKVALLECMEDIEQRGMELSVSGLRRLLKCTSAYIGAVALVVLGPGSQAKCDIDLYTRATGVTDAE